MDDIDCDFTDSVICPWCGKDQGNDEAHNSCDTDCDDCGKPYHREVDYSVSYSTWKIEPTPPAKGDSDE